MAAPSPMLMPARPRSNGRHGSGSISLQRIEPAEGQARERVGAAGQRRVEPAGADGIGGAADRDGARRTGRHDARAQSLEAEVAGDEVDRACSRSGSRHPTGGRASGRARASRGRSLSLRSRSLVPAPSSTPIRVGRVAPSAARRRPRLRARPRRRTDRRATSGGAGAASAVHRFGAVATSAATRLR